MGKDESVYAHSCQNLPPGPDWQGLEEHLAGVARRAMQFAASFDSDVWAGVVARLHDYGKVDPVFQGYLLRENGLDDTGYDDLQQGRVNHSSAGAALALERFGPFAGKVLAYLVAGHHAGLPDWDSADTGNAALSVRMREGRENLERIREAGKFLEAGLQDTRRPPGWVRPDNFHLWVRMLYSCLVDADYLDTEAFMDAERAGGRVPFPDVDHLRSDFNRYISDKTRSVPDTPVNKVRQEILAACRTAASEPPGLFSLTVPTGGGKTLSGMAFALDHAVQHGRQRIIYVIPYTSIIEQTAEELKRIFGAENVIEHHSSLDPDKETQRTRLAAENWDAPVVVTTNVQFFESLYAAKPGRCRKLHHIVNSVVILDEAQLLPPNLIRPCVDILNLLTRHFKVTVMLATATQPALPGLDVPREIISVPASLYARLKRTNIVFPDDIRETRTWPDIAAQLERHRQVLCVVNTRKDCLELFNLLPGGTMHLSALMCGQHRSEVIGDIKRRLKEGESVRVVSTQLVEAGVDMDFPVVYRALAGLDSIAQAAGRCNREGRLNDQGALGEVHVFVPPASAPRGLLRKGEDTIREVCALPDFDPDTPEVFQRYFTLFYTRVNDLGNDFYEWLVRDVNPDIRIQFRTAAANFKLIDDKSYRPVLVRYGEGESLLETLRIIGPKRDLMRKLQRYTVNVPIRKAHELFADGALEEIQPWILAQTYPSLYDARTGLNIYASNPDAEDLII